MQMLKVDSAENPLYPGGKGLAPSKKPRKRRISTHGERQSLGATGFFGRIYQAALSPVVAQSWRIAAKS